MGSSHQKSKINNHQSAFLLVTSHASRKRIDAIKKLPVLEIDDEEAGKWFDDNQKDLTTLVRTRLGWHLVEVTGRKPAEPRTFEQAKPEILSAFEAVKRRKAITDSREALRKDGFRLGSLGDMEALEDLAVGDMHRLGGDQPVGGLVLGGVRTRRCEASSSAMGWDSATRRTRGEDGLGF